MNSSPGRHLIRIDAAGDSRITDYADLRDRALLDRPPDEAAFIAEGEPVVRALIDSRFRVRSVLLIPERVERMADALDRLPPDVPVYVSSRDVLASIVGFPMHRGVLAAGERAPPPPADTLLADARGAIILEDLVNHDNVGGLFRVAAALGGPRVPVLLSPRTCDPLYRKSIRVSMGHALRVPYARLAPWPDAIRGLGARGFTTIALTPRSDARDVREIGPVDRPAIVLGTEGAGLTRGAIDACALAARIPMAPGVDSLSVVTAGAIALFHVLSPRA